MILELFVVLIGIALFLMWFGFKVQIRLFSIIGVTILLFLSLYIVFGPYVDKGSSLQYETGVNITQTTNGSIVTTTVENVYTVYSDVTSFWVGFLMSIVSFIGIILIASFKEV